LGYPGDVEPQFVSGLLGCFVLVQPFSPCSKAELVNAAAAILAHRPIVNREVVMSGASHLGGFA